MTVPLPQTPRHPQAAFFRTRPFHHLTPRSTAENHFGALRLEGFFMDGMECPLAPFPATV
jgi:hypothetical protein